MKKSILVDLNIITEYLKSGKGILPIAYEKYELNISAVTNTELLASKTFNDQTVQNDVLDFVKKYFTVIEVDQEISVMAGKLVRDYGITIAHAIVGATAIVSGFDVLSKDVDGFSNIVGITLIDID